MFFSLTPERCGRFHDALSCLARYSDAVTIDASPTKLSLTALNSTKSAYVCFTFDASFFFDYTFSAQETPQSDLGFSCQILNRALLAVFKGRQVDPRQRDNAIEQCEVSLDDVPEPAECRLEVTMIYKHGVTKRYKLHYESVGTVKALFDENRVTNKWKSHAKQLREYVEFFAPKTEQLDIYAEEGKCTFLAYTEKISHGKEILKHPLQTSVSIEVGDFLEFQVTENLHVVINVKDFRNMVIHAETLKTHVTAMYSQPSKPLQFSYSAEGMKCEFTLMTMGEAQSLDPAQMAHTAARTMPPRQASAAVREPSAARTSNMGPPPAPVSRQESQQPRLGRRLPQQSQRPPATQESESLFVAEDDDRQWQPMDEQEEEQDVLGWDASGQHDDSQFRSGLSARNDTRTMLPDDNRWPDGGIAPTQRASQYRGMFD